jgi:hypothetical protein
MTTTVPNDTINVRLVPTNVPTQWFCSACGGPMEKVTFLAEAETPDGTICICGGCLATGDIDAKLGRRIGQLAREVAALEAEVDLAERDGAPDKVISSIKGDAVNLGDFIETLRSAIGRLRVPSYESWKAAEAGDDWLLSFDSEEDRAAWRSQNKLPACA